MNELIDLYHRHIDGWYPCKRTRANLRAALRSLPACITDSTLDALRPAEVRTWLLTQTRQHTRQTANYRLQVFKQMLTWSIEQELTPPEASASLRLIRPIPAERGGSREQQRKLPVTWDTVTTTMQHCRPDVADMLEVMWHTGARPQEICDMQRSEITEAEDGTTAVYQPTRHKTSYRQRPRIILLGPAAWACLRHRWQRTPGSFLWGIRTTNGLQITLNRIFRRHNLPHWTIGQIRHSAATRFASQAGVETARILLGHASVKTTEIYAEPDMTRACQAITQLG